MEPHIDKLITIITYLGRHEKNLNRCIQGLKTQEKEVSMNWLILSHECPIIPNIGFTHIPLPKEVKNKAQAYNYILPTIETEFIAFNDADDKSLPNRFSIQLEFMKANPEADILGGHLLLNGKKCNWPRYLKHEEIRAFLLINNPMVNSTIMLRNNSKWGHEIKYNEELNRAEDYDFWFTCLRQGMIFSNLNLPLVDYLFHTALRPLELKIAREVRESLANYLLNRTFSNEELIGLHKLAENNCASRKEHLKIKQYWMDLSSNKEIRDVLSRLQFSNNLLSSIIKKLRIT